jgi:repressor LexA
MAAIEDPRTALAQAAASQGVSLARLSRLIGRNAAYVQQHVTRGSPRRLDERDREVIAAYLGIDESLLGAGRPAVTHVPRYDVAASAGGGALAEIEQPGRPLPLPADLLATLGVDASRASIIRVTGNSMLPTLAPDDEILIDAARRRVPRGGGVFVLRLGDVLMVKRVRPEGAGYRVTSDNPDAPSPGAVTAADADIIGRVVWVSRRL